MLPALSESRALRLVYFPVLYLAQGVPWGFVSVGYGVMLADLGLGNAAIGAALGLAYLPWSFKILWGPLLDAVPPLRFGRRRPFVVASELLMGLTLLSLWWVDPREQLALASAMLFLNNTVAGLQDVAIDAQAVDVLTDEERGRANALMWAGKLLGVSIGGAGGVMLSELAGWGAVFVALAAVVCAVALLPLAIRERPPAPGDRDVDRSLLRLGGFLLPFATVGGVMYALSTFEGEWVPIVQPFVAVLGALLTWPLVDRAGAREMVASFSTRLPWIGLLVALGTPVGYAMIQAANTRLLRAELHLSEEAIATLSGMIDPLIGVVGALVGGLLADRYGVRAVLAGAMAWIAAALLGFALARPLWPSFGFLAVWTGVFVAGISAYNAASLGAFMAISNPRIGATHFAVYMAATNLTYSWTAPFGGSVADRWGYPALFGVAAAIQLGTVLLLVPLDLRSAVRSR